MFEQSFVRPQSRVRTGWTVLVSTTIQVVLLCAAILVPLLSPDLLPRLIADSILLAPPDPPPGRAPLPERAAQPRALARRAAPAGFHEPAAVPERVAQIIDEPVEAGAVSAQQGVPGGLLEPGAGSSVLSSIIQAANTPAPPPKPEAEPLKTKPEAPRRIVLPSQLEPGMVLEKAQPVYPPMAIQMRLQGVVMLRTIVGVDGRIRELVVESGHPILVPAAVAAVRQWRYRPTVLNGKAVEVVAPVAVHFTLGR
jgi:protein TonB